MKICAVENQTPEIVELVDTASGRPPFQLGSVIETVVWQHADDAAFLASTRDTLTAAPHITLGDLGRFDSRLAAHLDGLSLAGPHGLSICDAALENPSVGAAFTIAVRAIEDQDEARLDRLYALAQAMPETTVGLLSAFGWVTKAQLRGTVARLLDGRDPFTKMIGIAACAMHRVDPGIHLVRFLEDADPQLRARSLRAGGEIGRVEMRSACAAAIRDRDAGCRMWGAWSAVLLGDRDSALDALAVASVAPGVDRSTAFHLALQGLGRAAHATLEGAFTIPGHLRWLIQGSGIAGDPVYVPWLIGHMANDQTARLAGEAFSLITGTDLPRLGLEGKPSDYFESAPNDDPDDQSVEMDPDDGLPWPEPERIKTWWTENGDRFQAGTRYFIGAPVTREHCLDVLKNGYQRQRILAAQYLCLLEPGTPLFNTSAPAWRQHRLLARME